ncbi:MAG: hypothetical protein ACI9UK_002359 [Candidatus Krumholzibacteriia bacterium]
MTVIFRRLSRCFHFHGNNYQIIAFKRPASEVPSFACCCGNCAVVGAIIRERCRANSGNRGLLAVYRYDNCLQEGARIKGSVCHGLYARDFPISINHTNQIALAGDRVFADMVGIFDLSELLSLEVGGTAENRHSLGHKTRDEVQDVEVRDNIPGADAVFEWSGFAQMNVGFDRVAFLLGTRYTKTDEFSENVSSRISTGAAFKSRLAFRAKRRWGLRITSILME